MNLDEIEVGQEVMYVSQNLMPCERGVVTSKNLTYVFVRYGNQLHSKATYAHDLVLVRKPPRESSDFYRCAVCAGVFEKGQTDEEAEAERVKNGWGDVECELICDDCFHKSLSPQHARPKL